MDSPIATNGQLKGKTVVVSGGAQGIGAAVARTIVGQGGTVVIGDVALEEASHIASELGDRARAFALDVTDEGSWSRLLGEAKAAFGAMHGLVTCAGILRTGSILDFDVDVFRQVLAVNLKGTLLGVKTLAPAIGEARGGTMVLVSSTEGLQGSNGMAAYASSKWAVRGLAKVAARELGAHDIRVNSIHPGPINTPMLNPNGLPTDQLRHSMFARMPLPRVAEASEIGDLCAFLLGEHSRFITGAEIAIDGGLTSGNFVQPPPSTAQVVA